MSTRLSTQTASGAALAMAIVAFADAQTDQVSLWPLYIGPVIAVSWEAGFVEGALAALVSGLLLVLSAYFAGHPYASHLFFLIASTSQVAVLVLIEPGSQADWQQCSRY